MPRSPKFSQTNRYAWPLTAKTVLLSRWWHERGGTPHPQNAYSCRAFAVVNGAIFFPSCCLSPVHPLLLQAWIITHFKPP